MPEIALPDKRHLCPRKPASYDTHECLPVSHQKAYSMLKMKCFNLPAPPLLARILNP